MRTFLYKLTSDRGGAPCAPAPSAGEDPLLTLSICKPAIRRTAQPGDRLIGLTSQSLHASEGYPLAAVIYAAVVDRAAEPREYYALDSPFGSRPDCIYAFHQELGRLVHSGRTPLHSDEAYLARDIGSYPYYRNARTLISHDFRYFGAGAMVIPPRLELLRHVAETLGQGHRVYEDGTPESREADALFRLLWKRETRFTPGVVESEASGHTPRTKKR
ncbi:Nmad2 family putative nucleotide modification protein [Granulicella cerasi]|uniref:Nmad2 family putative nucleotide modification protein n=1 Tax=Granulicella cerasi TaxID=741063 RepID=UPI0021DFC505|nr:hypothetical protein [Granulicella cerasi]